MNEGNPGGLLGSARRIFDSVLGLVQTRLQLFASEWESENLRLIDTLARIAVALSVVFLGLLMGTLTLALFVWKKAGFPGLVIMTAVILAAGVLLALRVRADLRKRPVPFAKTIAEFKKDRSCLETKE
jgi:uncharacterized membrane protein YqjE